MSKKGILAAVATIALMAGHAAPAQESKTVLGPTLFEECANAAIAAQRAETDVKAGIATCTEAAEHSWSTLSERAFAYLDRGTLHMARGENGLAIADFGRAIKANPGLAAAYNDRGVAYSALHRQADAVRDFTQALTLHAENADQILFNRAIAYEDQGDLKLAYLDYRAAAEINPGWSLPSEQLARFTVSRSPSS
jgi:tetratricopeptide (TPR) repeat protein